MGLVVKSVEKRSGRPGASPTCFALFEHDDAAAAVQLSADYLARRVRATWID